MKYWKLGCNWGAGNPDFYELLRKRRIVICAAADIAEGDWVLICHGFRCDALAHISSESIACTDRPELKDEFSRFGIGFEDWNRVADYDEFYELSENEKFLYPVRQGICQVQNGDVIENVEKIIRKKENP